MKRTILKFLQSIIDKKNRKRLKPASRTIISSNCTGGFIYHYLGLKFESPTINLFIKPQDYIKMLRNFDYYFDPELAIEEIVGEKEYPVGLLGDVKIYFMHYPSFDEAVKKWKERCRRINKDSLYIIMTDRDGCSYEDLLDFDALPYKHKIVFTHKNYPEISSSFYVRGFENENNVGELQRSMNVFGKRYIDQFDYVKFLNQ